MTAEQFMEKSSAYLGYSEKNGLYKNIIDIYNSKLPLPRGYRVSYRDEWCAVFVSAMAIVNGCTDIIPRECGVAEMFMLCKAMGIVKNTYSPQVGDIVFYQIRKNRLDHVGLIAEVSDNMIKVLEGNKSETVGYRVVEKGNNIVKYFARPRYDQKQDVVIPGDYGNIRRDRNRKKD